MQSAQRNRPKPPKRKDNYFVIVLSVSLVLGMATGVAVYMAWTSGVVAPGLDHPVTDAALLFCPPFILSLTIAPAPDSPLAWVLVVGTIVFANGFLYAGVASFGYFVVSTILKRRKANALGAAGHS